MYLFNFCKGNNYSTLLPEANDIVLNKYDISKDVRKLVCS